MAASDITFTTKAGTVKGLPSQLLGWLMVGVMAGFLLWKITGTFDDRLNKISESVEAQTRILERILDAVKK